MNEGQVLKQKTQAVKMNVPQHTELSEACVVINRPQAKLDMRYLFVVFISVFFSNNHKGLEFCEYFSVVCVCSVFLHVYMFTCCQ